MSGFKDPKNAQDVALRIEAHAQRKIADQVLLMAQATSRPDQAIVNLERWLASSSSPATMAETLASTPQLAQLLVQLFGASHQIADVLVQNPELANLVLDPSTYTERPDKEKIRANLATAISATSSYSHALDRLRFAKQAWHLRIAAADLSNAWQEPEVWAALSTVAVALVATARDLVWKNIAEQRQINGSCPVAIVAFGKLGGQELNFSSDIDLVYLLEDGTPPETEKAAAKFCEAFGRALSDRMGRGALYRVDLRLRPFGGTGPLAPKFSAVEGYYERYAEPWEHLALVRSRVIAGGAEVKERWSQMRQRVCFLPARGEWFVEGLLKMRDRIEERHDESDIKRGAGGIRDIEFLVQILQLLHGIDKPDLQGLATIETLCALRDHGIIERHAANEIAAAYTFLRQVEHRIQLLGDQQSHTVPEDEDERRSLAIRCGFSALRAFDSALALHRANARNWYTSVLRQSPSSEPREQVLQRAGSDAAILSQWIDAIPESETYYASLLENQSSLERVTKIAHAAPALVPMLKAHVSVTEQVLSGEILEPAEGLAKQGELAKAIKRAWLRTVVRWVLDPATDLGNALSDIYDETLKSLLEPTGLDTIALGSFGGRELALFSDLDVVFWKHGALDHELDEKQAQTVLASVQALRRSGAQIELDLRLRPEGKKGRLVHSAESFAQYAEAKMEPWERLALGRARASEPLPSQILEAAFGKPLDQVTVTSLERVKRRVENERVPVQYRRRHIKLGPGGQDDVLWAVGLLWWKHLGALKPNVSSVIERTKWLAEERLIAPEEARAIDSAWRFFAELRLRLGLLGYDDEVLPENPDKLARLGAVCGWGGANDVLAQNEDHANTVRTFLEHTWESLEG